MVHFPRRSSLIRPVPGVFLSPGYVPERVAAILGFNGLRLGFKVGAFVARAIPAGKLRALLLIAQISLRGTPGG